MIRKFHELYEEPQKATDYYYKFSQDTNYIRRYRIAKDRKWVTSRSTVIWISQLICPRIPRRNCGSQAGKTDLLSQVPLPENEGYAGRLNHPARQNHRIIPVTINKRRLCFQYSPYVYSTSTVSYSTVGPAMKLNVRRLQNCLIL